MNTNDLKTRMGKAVESLKEELAGLRTGRASTGLLENLVVDAYGSEMPLNQVATLSVPEPRMITVQPWDKSTVAAVERAIRDSDLGLNPMKDGGIIRVPLPELTEERRKELVRLAHKYGEQGKIAVRNIRRDGIDTAKKAEKNKEISQDDLRVLEKEIQDLTDDHVKQIDDVVQAKEADIMEV
ncbi:MAG: ribosome recycling factor [Magnetococcales bacterium]|nr:ribosome recycling factor [Magnetococcales bacterium]